MTNRKAAVNRTALAVLGAALAIFPPAAAQQPAATPATPAPNNSPNANAPTPGSDPKTGEAKPAAPAPADAAAPDLKANGKKHGKAGEPLQLIKKPPEPPKPLTREEAVNRANAFFNASPVMTADFVQIGSDGKRSEGRLHVQRAGRVRFEYAQPATMEVIADGAQVAIRDRKLGTQDLYFISQTPLKFLMKEKIDLEKDVTVEDVATDDAGVTIFIEDKATFGGTSHVRLIFDPKTFLLKQWEVKDPQGYETLISLFNVDQTKTPDPALFKITK